MINVEIKVEADRRYRCMVNLQRTDRPRYWIFNCPSCKMPIAEIANGEIYGINDLVDYQNTQNVMVGYRCDGRTGYGRCNIWYYFNLNPS